MNKKKNRGILLLLLFSIMIPAMGQNGINSPFSQFGIGELKTLYSHP